MLSLRNLESSFQGMFQLQFDCWRTPGERVSGSPLSEYWSGVSTLLQQCFCLIRGGQHLTHLPGELVSVGHAPRKKLVWLRLLWFESAKWPMGSCAESVFSTWPPYSGGLWNFEEEGCS